MPIVARMSEDNKTSTEQRGITLTLPPKEGRTGRLPKRLLTPLVKVQDFQRGLYLKAKRKVANTFRRVVIGKPCEGKPHARFDEGAVETQFGCAPLLYSTERQITQINYRRDNL